jgi:hypothetical protein
MMTAIDEAKTGRSVKKLIMPETPRGAGAESEML